MNYSLFMPTKVVQGLHALKQCEKDIRGFGKKALLVTGQNSALRSGALAEVTDLLFSLSISYEHYSEVENNPSLSNVEQGGQFARAWNPDFIVAIGGGSPLDAAKAIAVLARNEIPAKQLYNGPFRVPPLDILAIPTTAGTGSEVTQYSVLTVPEEKTKKGFGDPLLFPKLAILDARYLDSLPQEILIDTAVDALSHLVEGYLSKRALPISDMLALEGIRLFGKALPSLREGKRSLGLNDTLLATSMLGGMTIAHTGTTFLHALGYPLTVFHNLPHGRANGVLFAEYLRFTAAYSKERVQGVLDCLQLPSVSHFATIMQELFPKRIKLTAKEMKRYASVALTTKNVAQSLGTIDQGVLEKVFSQSLS